MTAQRHPAGLLAILCCAGIAGCTTTTTPSDDASSPPEALQPGLLVGTWTVEESFDTPEQPYVAFVQDNSWSASDGCNRVQGTWDLEAENTLTTTMGPQTLMGCDGVALPSAVSLATTVSVDGDSLTLSGADGSTSTVLVRSNDSTVGPQGLPIGYWTVERTPTSPFLSIQVDRTYSGSDDCGNVAGSWVEGEEADSITLQPDPAATETCDGADGWLGQATLARVRAGVMTLQSEDGAVLGELSAM